MSRSCSCGSGLDRRLLTDARCIPVGYVCDRCEATKRAKYRPEVFTDGSYHHDETLEEDRW
jgi:hypothetical protein